jgi:peptide/nickel transport system substrate-binding protein
VRLAVALSEDPGHLNPAITTSGGVHTASEILYDGLVRITSDFEVRPSLAERWEFLDDGKRVRFHLRTDVRWHDGTPFTARDVVYSLSEVVLLYHSRSRASLGGALESVDQVDDWTVELRFDSPYAPLLQQLDVTEAPILPAHLYEGTDPLSNPANRRPVGTGPFRFERYGADGFRYAANPDYHGGRPEIDEIVWHLVPDAGTQVSALQSGQLDWIFTVPGPDRRRLAEDPSVRFVESARGPGGSNCVMTLGFNLDRPFFQDVRMRRAIAHAIDRPQMLERVLFGQGRVAEAPISSGISFAHAAGLALPRHDPEASAELLDQLGWRLDGEMRLAEDVPGVEAGTPLRFAFTHFPSFTQYGQLLRAQLRSVGIDLQLRPLEPPVFVEAVFAERDFDTNIVSYCNGPDPEIGVRRMYVSASVAPIPFSNGAGYRNPTVDSLFDEARRSLDPADRGRLYRRIQEIVVEDLPYFWLVETRSARAHRIRCQGFTADGHFAAKARCAP